MINISVWMDLFLSKTEDTFANRVWFVGLQGSYGRGEAAEESDIDVVLILDTLTPSDIARYDEMLNALPHRELVCGFVSGKQELLSWEPFDLFQFYYDTKPFKGELTDLLPLLNVDAVTRAIKVGVCNIYHGCVHNMLHEKSAATVRALYKSASFVLQAIAFQQTGRYFSRQDDLILVLSEQDAIIANLFSCLKRGDVVDFEQASQTLLVWSQEWIRRA